MELEEESDAIRRVKQEFVNARTGRLLQSESQRGLRQNVTGRGWSTRVANRKIKTNTLMSAYGLFRTTDTRNKPTA